MRDALSGLFRDAGRTAALTALLALVLIEPALANKFETIGGGVAGSAGVKREWLRGFFWILSGVSLVAAILALVVPHGNPLYLNFNNWKTSSVVLLMLAGAFGALGIVI